MNKELDQYIHNLTKNDTKTLSGKALKVAEECGELAKAILPLESSAGTLHKFPNKIKALEEVADVYLAAISVAYDLGFAYEDFEEMVYKKTLYWQEIQQRESKINPNKIPFEIHVTVKPHQLITTRIDDFKNACSNLGVKPVVLDLQDSESKPIIGDVMTSSIHIGNNVSALNEVERIARGLENHGFTLVRKKIETAPWHPAAPQRDGDEMPPNCYFETHIGCIITNDEIKDHVQEFAKIYGAHLSRNILKKYEDGSYKQMLTLRHSKGNYVNFAVVAKSLYDELIQRGVICGKLNIEFSIYDTKVSHDSSWIKQSKEV